MKNFCVDFHLAQRFLKIKCFSSLPENFLHLKFFHRQVLEPAFLDLKFFFVILR